MGWVPSEIILDILSMLPVKSLIRFKCVCKSWNSLISQDSRFIKAHLQRSTQSDESRRILISSPRGTTYLRSICYSAGINVNVDGRRRRKKYLRHLDIPTCDCEACIKDINIKFLYSCNGLILLQYTFHYDDCCDAFRDYTLVLWNPSIRKHKVFPCSIDHNDVPISYGICHNFVVILLESCGWGPVVEVMVYDLSTDTWSCFDKRKNRPYDSIYSPKEGLLVNGRLHWVSERYWDMNCRSLYINTIVWYDAGQGAEFKELSPLPPECVEPAEYIDIELAVLRDQLCVSFRFFDDHGGQTFKIWVMNKYGDTESWTRLMVFPLGKGGTVLLGGGILTFTTKGEVLYKLVVNSEITYVIIYNPFECTCRKVRTYDHYGMFRSSDTLIDYVESLVDPNMMPICT